MSPLPLSSRHPEQHGTFVPRYEECWAKTTDDDKPGTGVFQHSLAAGFAARLLAQRLPDALRERLRLDEAGVCLAALHDLGKVTPGFQAKCAAWRAAHVPAEASRTWHGTETDHGRVTQHALQTLLGGEDSPLRFWAAAAGAHHGRLKGDRARLDSIAAAWNAERARLAEALCRRFGPLPVSLPHGREGDNAALWACAGLIAVADWLASDKRAFPPDLALTDVEIETRVARLLATVGFGAVTVPTGRPFAALFSFDPNALQSAVADIVDRAGVYVVEAPMGCGKTEAALAAAYRLFAAGHATGLYFALPTQTTSNRIHRRIQDFLDRLVGERCARLTHGTSWLAAEDAGVPTGALHDAEAPHAGRDWFASTRRALLAPFGVGTVDQALLGIVAAKHFFVRQFALAGKVVVLDEVHSYDLYTGTLIDKLVARLRDLGATVIVLSATLTAARRAQLLGEPASPAATTDPYPLISVRDDGGSLPPRSVSLGAPDRTVRVRFLLAAHIPDVALDAARQRACVLWIRNTVEDAQATARQLRSANQKGGPHIGLLHARYPLFRRERLEELWLGALDKGGATRPAKGCVLVATQVAEQSVDTDADLLITDLAPTDMLLQRIGRLWRHDRPGVTRHRDAPEVWIQLPALDLPQLRAADVAAIRTALGRSASVYAPYVLLRSLAEWRNRDAVVLPRDIRPLLEATYAAPPPDEPAAWQELRALLEKRKRLMAEKALANANPWLVALADEEGVQTRWGGCPRTPILPILDTTDWARGRLRLLDPQQPEVSVPPHGFSLAAAKAIHRNLVHVPAWTVRGLDIERPSWLTAHAPHDIVPLKLAADGHLRTLSGSETCSETCLSWHPTDGILIRRDDRTARAARDSWKDDDESYD